MNINENQWTLMKMYENQRKSMEINKNNENQWTSMKTNENQWKNLKINKTMKINEN